jgi:ABC-type glycerol-3-phosphate transport system substrate-binding protein
MYKVKKAFGMILAVLMLLTACSPSQPIPVRPVMYNNAAAGPLKILTHHDANSGNWRNFTKEFIANYPNVDIDDRWKHKYGYYSGKYNTDRRIQFNLLMETG